MAKQRRDGTTEKRRSGITAAPVFKPKPIAVAVALAMVPAIGLADYRSNVELYAIPTTESRTLTGVAGLMPFGQTNSSLYYGDLRYTRSTANINEFNLLLGHRSLGADNNWIMGGYLAYDRRRSRSGRNYNQFGIGFEALSDGFDFRANYYHPTTGKRFLGYTGASYAGNNLVLHELYEEALRGGDVEVGFNPNLIGDMETRFYLGGYHYEGDVAGDANGVRVRAELRPLKSVTVGLSFEDDHLFGSKGMLELRYSFGYPNERGRRTLPERMTEFARRDIDIRETSVLPQGGSMSGSVNGLAALGYSDMIHIDNTNTVDGDGTAENPYRTIDLCDAGAGVAGCQDANTLVYVHYGDGTDTGLDTGFDMPSGQTIIGEGYNFYGLGGNGLFPLVSNGSDYTIILNDDTEVAGLEIYNNNYHAIYGAGIQNVSIHHNRVYSYSGDGINLDSVTGTISIVGNQIESDEEDAFDLELGPGDSTTLQFHGNSLYSDDDDGLDIEVYGAGTSFIASISDNLIGADEDGIDIAAGYGSSSQITISGNQIEAGNDGIFIVAYGPDTVQSVTVSGNQIASGGEGAAFYAGAEGGGALTQNVTLSDNQITSEGSEGMAFYAYSYDGAVVTQNLNLSGNTVDSYMTGVYLFAGAEGGSVTQNATLSDNQITSVDEAGLYVWAYSQYDGSSTQHITLENNTITGAEGVQVWQVAGAEGGLPSVATQTFTATGNTFHLTDGGEGIAIYNLAGYYGTATQVVDLRDNILSADGSEGASLYVVNGPGSYLGNGGTGVQTVTLVNNQISGYGFFDNFVGSEGSGVGTQTVDITGTSFGNGIGIYNFAAEGGAVATQTVDFGGGGNSAGTYGTYIENDYSSGGTATQTVDLRNNNEALSPVVCSGNDTQTIIGGCDVGP